MEFTACKNKKHKNAANIRMLPGNYEPPGIYAPFSTGAAAGWFLALHDRILLEDWFGITVFALSQSPVLPDAAELSGGALRMIYDVGLPGRF